MTDTAVDAHGEAPNKAAILPSADVTNSVPNWRIPHFCGCFLMICTRLPASCNCRSFSSACGKYMRNASKRCACVCIDCWIKYWVNHMFFAPAVSIGIILCGRIEVNRSRIDPCFKNFVVHHA